MPPMRLEELLGNRQAPDVVIEGLAVDSRQVAPGYLFAAFKGTHDDGRRHIGDALKRGARAILLDDDEITGETGDAVVIKSRNPRRELALMAARFFGRQPEVTVCVTGTNGKSSVAELWRQLAALLGHKAASIGTLGIIGDGDTRGFGLTTPDSIYLQEELARLADHGISHVCFEASSHGLAQHRSDGAQLTAAAFTNFSRDHLDYHASVEEYLFAKLRLPGELLEPGHTIVVNADDAVSAEVESIAWARGVTVLSIGERGSGLTLLKREKLSHGQRLFLRHGQKEYRIDLPLVGSFQASNALMAAGLMIACGEKPAKVLPLLAQLQPVPGRLQHVGATITGAQVYVDYAHTPDGLETVLKALRKHTAAKLVAVFGAGGDRDPGKRPLMGEVAAKLADHAIVTDDNPRGEDAAKIRAAILAACPGAENIGDRAQAIARGLQCVGAGDTLLIAGKGHETGQVVAGKTLPFSDIEVVQKLLRETQP